MLAGDGSMAVGNAYGLSIGLCVGSVVGNGFGFRDLMDALRLTDLHFAFLSIAAVLGRRWR
jgi:ribulose 1,5-bisphosphate carboxylase large subunit-like protein